MAMAMTSTTDDVILILILKAALELTFTNARRNCASDHVTNM